MVSAIDEARILYLDLIEKCILNTIYEDPATDPGATPKFDKAKREVGVDWPSVAHSMIGVKRMRNLRMVCEAVIGDGIEGDFIETGVWRGGACIMMRAILKAYGDTSRRVWVADSFEGLPKPRAEYPADIGSSFHECDALAVSLEQVRANFQKYDLLDDQVCFLKGWFRDVLPTASIDRLAVLRLDGDMYGSTMEALDALYDKVSEGGYVIVDDFGMILACRQAVIDFIERRNLHVIADNIDGTGIFWQKVV